MRMFDIIRHKRDGYELTPEEIRYFIQGYVRGEIPDYQVSALLMAIYFRGMSYSETAELTFAIRDSGEILDFSDLSGIRVDKHSTGGVGDKTSLVVAPIVASLGVKVAKMSGRGLGHTGGTVDKLESIPGFKTQIDNSEFLRIVNQIGVSIVGQNANLAPADKLLYALRDVTATVDIIPLIASSIMGKKLAADDDCILLDVKTGSGSFCKTLEESRELARCMTDIGKRAGKKMLAVITDMDAPLGCAIGNSLEVIEAIDTLQGKGTKDFSSLCITLAAEMLCLTEYGTYWECEQAVIRSVDTGLAFDTFVNMVRAQGGDTSCILCTDKFPKARFTYSVKAPKSGYISSVNAEGYGIASSLLGSGRNRKEDKIDSTAGILLRHKTGDYIEKGEELALLCANDEKLFELSEHKLIESTNITETKPEKRPLVFERIH